MPIFVLTQILYVIFGPFLPVLASIYLPPVAWHFLQETVRDGTVSGMGATPKRDGTGWELPP